jgi:hypothetical protein
LTTRVDAAVHLSRFEDGAAYGRSGGGDVSRPHRGKRGGGAHIRGAEAPLHDRAIGERAEAAAGGERGGGVPADQRGAAVSAVATAGLSLPSTLPAGNGGVPGGTAGINCAGGWIAGDVALGRYRQQRSQVIVLRRDRVQLPLDNTRKKVQGRGKLLRCEANRHRVLQSDVVAQFFCFRFQLVGD